MPRYDVGQLGQALRRALEQDGPEVDRLAYARTSVRLMLPDGPALTLLLDRTPPALGADEPGEVELELTHEQAERFAVGELPMTRAVLTGEVAARGPVRAYLEVDPILRELLRRGAGGGAARPDVEPAASAGDPPAELLAVETRGLEKSFGTQSVLRGMDLRVPEGVISVVLGPSGTGKSVLLQHVIGLMAPDAGEVLVRGRALSAMSRSELLALRRDIGVMFQDGALFSAMTVFENVAFPLRQHTDLSEAEVAEVVGDALAGVGLADAADRLPSQLSGGMKKRAGLARALVIEPGILLVDEPDSGLDPVRTALLGEVLAAQHARYGGTMIVVTHNVMLARRIADHVSVVWQGKVLVSGLAEEVIASEDPFVQQFLSGSTAGPLGMDA